MSVLCPGAVNTDFWNSEQHRQAQFGQPGETSDFARRAMGYGLDPQEIGRIALRDVQQGEFLIFTSPFEREVAEIRWNDIDQAFTRQWPNGPRPDQLSSSEIQEPVTLDL